jgi:hypothetical protein
MRKIRPAVSGLLVAGFILGTAGLPGCGNPEEGSAPKLSGKKDDIQKSTQSGVPGKTTPGRRGPG